MSINNVKPLEANLRNRLQVVYDIFIQISGVKNVMLFLHWCISLYLLLHHFRFSHIIYCDIHRDIDSELFNNHPTYTWLYDFCHREN